MKQKTKRILLSVAFLFFVTGFFPLISMGAFRFLGAVSIGLSVLILVWVFLLMQENKHPRIAKILQRTYCCILCIILICAVATGAVIWNSAMGDSDYSGEYILVLGAMVDDTEPSLSLQNRIDAAGDYLFNHPNTICIASGGLGTTATISEAECISRSLQKLGISEERIWKEENATTTKENISNSLLLIQNRTGNKPDSIGIVSSEYHLFRAKHFANELGIQAYGIPAETSWLSLKVNYFLREIAAVWYYYILGG